MVVVVAVAVVLVTVVFFFVVVHAGCRRDCLSSTAGCPVHPHAGVAQLATCVRVSSPPHTAPSANVAVHFVKLKTAFALQQG